MKTNPENIATPIHNNINRRGTLRKLERTKNRKSTAESNTDSLMLTFNNTFDSFNDSFKGLAFQKVSMMASMRVRSLKKGHVLGQRKGVFDGKQKLELRLQPTSEAFYKRNEKCEIKNKLPFNTFICRRATPISLTSFSRSKTARQYPIARSQKQDSINSAQKAIQGYQISSHSPMNRKISFNISSNQQ